MKLRLLIVLLASLLARPVHAQFYGSPSADDYSERLGETPKPEGRTRDRNTKPPRQVDFSAPRQIDFSMDAAPDTPADPDSRAPAHRTPARMDRAVDRLADEAVDSGIGASNTPKNEADRSLSLRQ